MEEKVRKNLEEKLRRLEKTPFPKVLNIETTSVCNLRCPMCPRTTVMERKPEHMDFKIFKKVVDEASLYGVGGVWLHVFGEPLLHPQIISFIEYIKKFDNIKNVGISTNATVLDEETSRRLLSSGLDRIILSVDAASPEVYEKIRGADFMKVVKNVNNFLNMRHEMRASMKVELSIIDMALNRSEIAAFESFWKERLKREGDELLIKRFVNFGSQVKDFSADTSPNGKKRVPCRKLWNSLTILSNGKVVACCYDVNGVLYLGDVSRENLAHIWKGDNLRRLRRIHMDRRFEEIPLCNECSATIA